MFYRCRPAAHRPVALRAPAKTARGARRQFTVDIHAHLIVPEAEALTHPHFKPEYEPFLKFASAQSIALNRERWQAIHGKMTDTGLRIADLDAAGIDVQVVAASPHQYHYWAEPELGRAAARLVNDRIAEIAAQHPDRIAGLATLPLQAPELAVAELERAVRQLGLRGVEIGTNIEGVELSDPRFRKFWAKAEELGILVFLHPVGSSDGARLSDHYFINVIGNPLDSTLAVAHLIFGGVLESYPKLKICVAHGGGYLPAYAGRTDHAFAHRPDSRTHLKRPPSHYLKKLYFDTIVFTTHQLEYLVSLYGSDHILLGTDYPYDMGMADPVGFIDSTKLGIEAKAAIKGLNAARLLKLRVPAIRPVKKTRPKRKAKPARRK